MYGSHRHAQEQLTFNSFSVAAVATPSSPRRCASAFNSFSVASPPHRQGGQAARPGLQFFLNCFLEDVGAERDDGPVPEFSILSQLLHVPARGDLERYAARQPFNSFSVASLSMIAHLAEQAPRDFQFFLSCFSLGRGRFCRPVACLSILSQLLQTSRMSIWAGPWLSFSQPFNSFSVASWSWLGCSTTWSTRSPLSILSQLLLGDAPGGEEVCDHLPFNSFSVAS